MSASLQELHHEMKRHRDLLEHHHADIKRIRQLLEKADAKLRDPGEDRRKWSRVADHLETTLDEAKARRAKAEIDLQRLEKEVALRTDKLTPADLTPSPHTTCSDEEPPAPAHFEFDLPPRPLSLAQHLIEAPIESLNHVPLEDMVMLESSLPAESALNTTDDGRRLLGRIEIANQTYEPDPAAFEPGQDRRKQLVLRAAIEKLQANKLDEMSADEVRMMLVCHSLLSRRLDPSPRDKHLLRILSACLKVLRRKNAETMRIVGQFD